MQTEDGMRQVKIITPNLDNEWKYYDAIVYLINE